MTIATRALFTGATDAPALPIATLTSAPNGGNNPWTVPGAIHAEGKTHIGYVDGSGNIEVITVLDDGTVQGPYLISATYQQDAHASPVLCRRASDGRLIILYALHAPGQQDIRVRVSTNPDDASSWDSSVNIHSQLGGDEYADYGLWEYGGTLYLIFRHELNGVQDSYWSLSTCDASTPTSGWATKSTVFRIASTRSYVITRLDPDNGRLHFATTGAASGNYQDIGHFYLDLDAGTYHKSDGTDISASVPLDLTDITTVWEGTYYNLPSNVAIDPSGHPVIAVWDVISSERRYIYARWSGSAWVTTNVASGDDGYAYNEGAAANDYNPWGSCIDLLDPNVMWVIEEVGGETEVAYYRTRDAGATFERRAVTADGSGTKLQIIPVVDPHRSLRVFWHEGTWTDYDDWSTGLRGAGF